MEDIKYPMIMKARITKNKDGSLNYTFKCGCLIKCSTTNNHYICEYHYIEGFSSIQHKKLVY